MTKFSMLGVFALTVAGLMPVGVACAAGPDESAVRAANEQFYKALNTMFTGDAAPMESVWSHADDVTYLGPDGKFLVGWDTVSDTWKQQAALNLRGAIREDGIQVKVGTDLATVECSEVGENLVNGKVTPVSIRATNVYRKENGQWKMIGHHTDKLPFLDK